MSEIDCVFCKIISGKIPAKIAYQDEDILAFHDITPIAPIHILVIPKKHISNLIQCSEAESQVIGKIFIKIKELAVSYGVSEKGFRIVNNCGEFGGQTVHHIHFHLLGGRHFTWPPG